MPVELWQTPPVHKTLPPVGRADPAGTAGETRKQVMKAKKGQECQRMIINM